MNRTKPSQIVAIVPARGGSRRLPGKNIREFGGVPMIGWTLQVAKRSRYIQRCVVSTDSEEIATVVRSLGGEAPFLRPPELASDEAPTLDTLQHAVRWIENDQSHPVRIVVLLQPTSPLRVASDIDEAVERLDSAPCESVETVSHNRDYPQHLARIDEDGRLHPLPGEASETDSVVGPTGSVYVIRREVLMEQHQIRGRDHRGLIREASVSVDIDTAADFDRAEEFLRQRLQQETEFTT